MNRKIEIKKYQPLSKTLNLPAAQFSHILLFATILHLTKI